MHSAVGIPRRQAGEDVKFCLFILIAASAHAVTGVGDPDSPEQRRRHADLRCRAVRLHGEFPASTRGCADQSWTAIQPAPGVSQHDCFPVGYERIENGNR